MSFYRLRMLPTQLKWRLKCSWQSMSYRFRHWAFQWKQDEEGDIAFVVLGRIAFVKYKEHTIVRLTGHKMADAPKYVKADA